MPQGTDFRWREAGVCFVLWGEVSEPRTYLANEVVITPWLTNRMKAGGSFKSY